MLAKVWKRLALLILIVACLFNITIKLIKKASFKDELRNSAQYIYDETIKTEKK